MNAQKLLEFAKVNSGAGVAIGLLFYFYNGQNERLEKVEQKLFDCYMTKQVISQATNEAEKTTIKFKQLVAILPEKQKLYEYTSEN